MTSIVGFSGILSETTRSFYSSLVIVIMYKEYVKYVYKEYVKSSVYVCKEYVKSSAIRPIMTRLPRKYEYRLVAIINERKT